jgi:hypothetical protein
MTIYLDIGKVYNYLFFVVFILLFVLANNTVVSEELDKDSRIRELERKLENVTTEVNKLKEQSSLNDKITEIEDKLTIIVEEIENLKSSSVAKEPGYEEKHGRSEGASKVYLVDKGISIGGYGELFIGQLRDGSDNTVDAQRAVLYFGYKFTDNIVFNSEIEFEHASTEDNLDGRDGSVSVEFASLDFLIMDELNLRAGLLLAPFGIINEYHEPTTFFGVLRPEVERNIIPTTWRENGAGIFGEINNLLPGYVSYRLYVMNSFDSRGFEASDNRGLRTRGNRSRFNDLAVVGRVEYQPVPEIKLGGSIFLGQTGQNERVDGQTIDGFFQMYEADVQLQWKGFEGRGLFVYTFLDDVQLINANNGLVGDDSVGEEQFGWYVEGAYNILSLADIHPYFQYLAPFVRFEKFDTQNQVPDGFLRNPENNRDVLTLGLSYKPIPNVVVKIDYQNRDNKANSSNDQINLGLGYVF